MTNLVFRYHRTVPNYDYLNGLSLVADHRSNVDSATQRDQYKRRYKREFRHFESCLKHNNSENDPLKLIVKRAPKFYSVLLKSKVDQDTGEISPQREWHWSDDLQQGRRRKIRAVKKFADYFEPLYKKKEVSLLFLTFTRMNYARLTFPRMLDNIRYHVETQLGIKIRGFIWVLEASNGNHLHYHLCLAIDRLNAKKMPNELKFDSLWGQRTQVTFVRKTIRGYLMKYLSKENSAVVGFRSYGISRRFI